MGWRGTLLLGILVALAAAYAWVDVASDSPQSFWQAVFDPRPTPPGEAVKRLLHFDPTTVTTVRIQKGRVTLQVTRTDGGWNYARRPDGVDDLLQSLVDLAEILVLDADGRELADYGLDPAEAVIELRRRDAEPITLSIGHRNPSATAVYIRVGRGGPVVLTGSLLLWELDKAVKGMSATVDSRS